MAFVNCFASANAPKYVGMTGMGDILMFRPSARRSRDFAGRLEGMARILFFTGVRYEREYTAVARSEEHTSELQSH